MVGASLPAEWSDTNPYFLVISTDTEQHYVLDLGKSGWMTEHEGLMREAGRWALFSKQTLLPVLRLRVFEGEQPYYVARHVGIAGSGGSNEITAYGIGKKRLDGHHDRLWVFPDGSVAGGDDVDGFAIGFLHQMGPR